MALLDADARRALLQRARAAIAHAIGAPPVATPFSDPIPNPQSPIPGIPGDLRAGAFVTIRIKGQLRGCIGYPEARAAAHRGRRALRGVRGDLGPAISAAERARVERRRCRALGARTDRARRRHRRESSIGRDGLIVESGRRRGLLLPQVAVEWKWDAAEFAAQTCIKAGLPRDAWQKGAKLFKFEAEVFGEAD